MRKGSLSLSMNAIVILILAITLLGLGLSFMRGLFRQMEIKTAAAVDAHELTNPPTSDNPVTTAPGSVTIRTNERAKILLAFMNVEAETKYCQLTMWDSGGGDIRKCYADPASGDCVPEGSQTDDIVIFSDQASPMEPDQTNTWTLSVDGDQGTSGQTYIVTARICCQDVSPTGDASCVEATDDGVQFKKDIMITVTA